MGKKRQDRVGISLSKDLYKASTNRKGSMTKKMRAFNKASDKDANARSKRALVDKSKSLSKSTRSGADNDSSKASSALEKASKSRKQTTNSNGIFQKRNKRKTKEALSTATNLRKKANKLP